MTKLAAVAHFFARTISVLMLVLMLVATSAGVPAHALVPPLADVAAAPPDGPPAPDGPMRETGGAVFGGIMPASDLSKPPPAYTALQLDQAHKFSTGAGVIVAVIDSGVRPQMRLPGMIPGGDYIASTDGFVDLDGHGTIVAGIIGAAPSPTDGLVGVAPNAQILAIRQWSGAYTPQGVGNPDDPNESRTAGDIRGTARAIVHAVNLGAKVINISSVNCVKVSDPIDQSMLGGALAYAVDVKDVVVVAAAGNVKNVDGGNNRTTCASNPDIDPAKPDDPRNWGAVSVVSSPSWFDDHVLSVGYVSPEGIRAEATMLGPWVDVAAPGSGVVSLTNGEGDGVINGVPTKEHGMVAIAGTSYSAAYVSGVAALLRARFPDWSARQIAARIMTTAHHPPRGVDNAVGAGMIDPVAALTSDSSIVGQPDMTPKAAALSIPAPPPGKDPLPNRFAVIVTAAIVGILVITMLVVIALGASRKQGDKRGDLA